MSKQNLLGIIYIIWGWGGGEVAERLIDNRRACLAKLSRDELGVPEDLWDAWSAVGGGRGGMLKRKRREVEGEGEGEREGEREGEVEGGSTQYSKIE